MAGLGKAKFQRLLGERGIVKLVDEADFDQDLSNQSGEISANRPTATIES